MKKVLSTFLMATMVLSVFACVVPVQSATVGTLELSAPYINTGGIIEVKLYDPDLTADTVTVTVSWGSDSDTMTLAKSSSSGTYYGYLGDLTSGNPANPRVPALTTQLFDLDEGTVTVTYTDESPSGTVSASFTYGEYVATTSDITFDRTTYPLNGHVQIKIRDWDYNNDPTLIEELDTNINLTPVVTNVDIPLGLVTLTETGPSTGIFAEKVSYWTDDTFNGYTIPLGDVTGPVKVTYADETNEPFAYFYLASSAVSMIVPSTFTTTGDLQITVNDPNANHDALAKETLATTGSYVKVFTSGGDSVQLDTQFAETSASSGQFTYTIPVVIGPAAANNVLEVGADGTVYTVEYSYAGVIVASTSSTFDASPAATLATDKNLYKDNAKVTMTLNAATLNDNTALINFFQGTATDTEEINAITFLLNGLTVGKLTVKVNDELAIANGDQIITFVETGVNTGVYTATLDLAKVLNNDGEALVNDDVVSVTWSDEVNAESTTASFTIGVAAATFTLDRTSYPTPKDGTIKIYVNATDSARNTLPAIAEEYDDVARIIVYFYDGSVAIAETNIHLTESGPNTGIFTGSAPIPANDDKKYIGGWFKVLYADLASSKDLSQTVYFSLTNAALTVNASSVSAGQALKFTVTDPDMNFDSKIAEQFNLDYSYKNLAGTTVDTTVTVKETGKNTGVFEGTITIGSTIYVKPGSTITAEYADATPTFSTATGGYGTAQTYTATASVPSNTGTISIDKATYGLNTKMKVTVTDTDLNTKIDTIETVDVTLRMSGFADVTLTLTETNASSPVFTVTHQWDADEDRLGKTFQIYYLDAADASGNSVYAIATGQVISNDASVAFDKSAYLMSEIVTITVTDPDANTNPDTLQQINVLVTSTSDPIGQTFVATETGANTGIFTVQVQLSSTLGAGKVFTKNGDTLTAKYTDPYPADFGTTGKSKAFTGTATVGVTVERPVPASDMQFLDPSTGQPVSATTGTTLMLQATLKNEDSASKSFTAIFKVIDANGVTISISWVTGTLAAGQTMSPAVSWMPTAAGAYTVEVLVIKSISEPTPYSDKVSQSLTVA